jgi:hypothetical protein
MASVKGAGPENSEKYVGWFGHGHHKVRFGMPSPDDRRIMHSALGLPVEECIQRIPGDEHKRNLRGPWRREGHRQWRGMDRDAASRAWKHRHKVTNTPPHQLLTHCVRLHFACISSRWHFDQNLLGFTQLWYERDEARTQFERGWQERGNGAILQNSVVVRDCAAICAATRLEYFLSLSLSLSLSLPISASVYSSPRTPVGVYACFVCVRLCANLATTVC